MYRCEAVIPGNATLSFIFVVHFYFYTFLCLLSIHFLFKNKCVECAVYLIAGGSVCASVVQVGGSVERKAVETEAILESNNEKCTKHLTLL